MRVNRSQTLDAAQVAAHATPRRRSVPTRRSTPVQQSLHQRWRERPRCAASPLTPGCRDGVVHAIVGRVPCRCPRVLCVQEHRAARVPMLVPTRRRRRGPAMRNAVGSRAVPAFLQNLSRSLVMIIPPTIAPTMLAPCSASSMLSAWLRPGPRPGLRALTTPARGIPNSYAMVVRVMPAGWGLTRVFRRRMLTASPQCRTALLRFATPASGARIRPTPAGHGIERTRQDITARTFRPLAAQRPRTCVAMRQRSPRGRIRL